MKKIVACIFVGILCFAFVACGGKSSSPNEGVLPDEVANKDDLDFYECNDDVVGERVYVADIELFYECDGERWFKSYDQTRTSSSTASSEIRSSSSIDVTSEDFCASEMEVDESDKWIDGKTVFPAGTFDCSTYNCRSTDPLNPDITYGEILDERDNQVYKVLRIGKRIWFAQNLNFETTSSSKSDMYLGRSYSWCDIMNLPGGKCGMEIYSNISDISHQGICPDGWHVPNKKETIGLFCALGASSLNYKISSKVSTGFTSDSTNMSGLSVVYDSRWVAFATSTEYNDKSTWTWAWCSGWDDFADVFPEPYSRVGNGRWKNESLMVRCVRNEKDDASENLLPVCDLDHEGLVVPKDTMYFICKNGLYRRATDVERVTYGEVCSDADIGKVVGPYCCTVNGWENVNKWSWNVPKDIRLNPKIQYGSFEDKRDGQIYKTVEIENQVWMAQNLNYADSVKTPNLKGNSWCYENDVTHCDVGGRLYTWEAAVDAFADSEAISSCGGDSVCLLSAKVRGICPEGFHLPSYNEWSGIGFYSEYYKTQTGWDDYYVSGYGGGYRSGNGNDALGLSIIPAGTWEKNGERYSFLGAGTDASFWSSTEADSSYAWGLSLESGSGFVDRGKYVSMLDQMSGRSIRCVKDKE